MTESNVPTQELSQGDTVRDHTGRVLVVDHIEPATILYRGVPEPAYSVSLVDPTNGSDVHHIVSTQTRWTLWTK